ncbi:hypothetical protein ACFQT0_29065 [Hymenobacter humi]|uniref:L,D-transpeptidase scaffold domain-containing protein n=1 Tax=Hymenobacter humi TaxID=1411620 RepID=A0ABW2UFP6_9BACT
MFWFLTFQTVFIRIVSLISILLVGILLVWQRRPTVQPAGLEQHSRGRVQAFAAPPAPEPSVDSLLKVLLAVDTTGIGKADTRLGLQVGPSVRAFYREAPQPVWTAGADSINPNATNALGLLADAAAYGLRAADYGGSRLPALRDSLSRFPAGPRHHLQQARLEIYLSDALLRFTLDLYRGRLRSQTLSPREKRAKHPLSRPGHCAPAWPAAGW